jgi:hypothetical protein
MPMGPKQGRSTVESTDDIAMFYGRTGIICNNEQLEWLDLHPHESFGLFDESQAAVLLDFCANNPQYHIISGTQPGRMENRFVPGQRIYYLADGDDYPHLVLNIFLKKNVFSLAEEMFDAALAIIPDVDRGNKAQ